MIELQEKPVSENQNGGSNNNPEYSSKKKWGRVAFVATMEMVIILGVWYNVNLGNSEPETKENENNKAIPTVYVKPPCDTNPSNDSVGSNGDKLPSCEVVKKNFDLKAWFKRISTNLSPTTSRHFMDAISRSPEPVKNDAADKFVPDFGIADAPKLVPYNDSGLLSKKRDKYINGTKATIYVHAFTREDKSTKQKTIFYTKGVQKAENINVSYEVKFALIRESEALKESIKAGYELAGIKVTPDDLNELVKIIDTPNFYGFEMPFLGETLFELFDSKKITADQLGEYFARGMQIHDSVNLAMGITSDDFQIDNFVFKKGPNGENFLTPIDFGDFVRDGNAKNFEQSVDASYRLIEYLTNKHSQQNSKKETLEFVQSLIRNLSLIPNRGIIAQNALVSAQKKEAFLLRR